MTYMLEDYVMRSMLLLHIMVTLALGEHNWDMKPGPRGMSISSYTVTRILRPWGSLEVSVHCLIGCFKPAEVVTRVMILV